MITFSDIHIKNFQSIKDLSFEFKQGLHLVSGQNGAGKSTLFEALEWALYGKSSKDRNVSFNGNGDCKVTVNFHGNGDVYSVTRGYKDSIIGNKVILEKNGVECETDVEDSIVSAMGVSHNIFTFVYLIMQGLPVSFSNLQPTARKLILEDLFSFTAWPEIKKKFDKRYEEVYNDFEKVEFELKNLQNNEIGLYTTVKNLSDTVDRIKDNEQTDTTPYIEKLTGNASEIESLRDALSSYNLNSLLEKKASYTLVINTLERDIQANSTIVNTGACFACGAKHSDEKVNEASETLSFDQGKKLKLEVMLGDVNNDISKASYIESTISSLERESQFLSSKIAQANKSNHKELDHYQKEVAKHAILLDKVKEDLITKTDEFNAVSTELSNLKLVSSLMLPSSKFRTKVLVNSIEEISKCVASVCDEYMLDTKISLKVSSNGAGVDMDITRNGKRVKYKSFSSGQQRVIDIILIQAFRRFIFRATGVSINLSVFDEIFDGLDASNVELAVLMINQMSNDDGLSTYVVSHRDNLKSKFDSIVNVEINKGVTHVAENNII